MWDAHHTLQESLTTQTRRRFPAAHSFLWLNVTPYRPLAGRGVIPDYFGDQFPRSRL